MAVWQFKLSLLPRAGIQRVHGSPLIVLDEYCSSPDKAPRVIPDEEMRDYWLEQEIEFVAKAMAELLPATASWSRDARMFGDEEGDHIQIWSDEIYCAFDLRAFSPSYLNSVVGVACRFDCKLVLHGSGEVMDPNVEELLKRIGASPALKFCLDPERFLSELARP